MLNIQNFAFFVLFLFALSATQHVQAQQALNYDAPLKASAKYQVTEFIKKSYNGNPELFKIAQTDLNNDGINEYILKRLSCIKANNSCSHLILGETNNNMRLLSTIKARHIMLAGTSSFGVNDLLVFQNDINDYDFDIYMWSSTEKMYILEKQDKKDL